MNVPAVTRIRVVSADDSYMIREFIKTVLGSAPGIELVAVCSNAEELELAIETASPDVVLTGIRMPPLGAGEGIRIAARLRDTAPQVGVVVLSAFAEPAYALGLFASGTRRRAYLLKERVRDRQELIDAIGQVARGGSAIDPAIVDILIQAGSRATHPRLSQLTPREREILAEIASAKSNGAIADSLVLTKRAVEKHVNAIFSKLDLRDAEDVSPRVKATLIFLDEQNDDAARPDNSALARRATHSPVDGAEAEVLV